MTNENGEDRACFERLHGRHFQSIAAYVRRRVPESDAPDVIAQVFAVAWRRLDRIPAEPEDRLWLFGVARRSVADSRRSWGRRTRLLERLASAPQRVEYPNNGDDPVRERVYQSIAKLPQKDQEILRLILWEELSHAEAGVVLGCSANAVTLRYRRAKERLENDLMMEPAPTGLIEPISVTPENWTA